MATDKVIILTVAHGVDPQVLASIRRNRELYAMAHNYTYCEYSALLDPSRTPSWNKVLALLTALQSAHLVFVLDADALIRNYTISLRSLYATWSSGGQRDVLFASDYDLKPDEVPLTGSSSLNHGAVLVRSSPWSVAFYTAVFNAFPGAVHLERRWWEQAAILAYRARQPADFLAHTRILPHRLFNNHLEHYRRGDFVSHFAGMAADTKWVNVDALFLRDCEDEGRAPGGCLRSHDLPSRKHDLTCDSRLSRPALGFLHLLLRLPNALCQRVLGASRVCYLGLHLPETSVTVLGQLSDAPVGAAHQLHHLRICQAWRTGVLLKAARP